LLGEILIATPKGTSQRLRFEPLIPGQALSLSEALLDPAVYAPFGGTPPKSIEALTALLERRAAGPPVNLPSERWWNIAVFSLADNCGLGRLEATIIDDHAEIAYLFGSKHWGNGYAQEAMRWFQERLAEDGAASKLWAAITPNNERSIRLVQRLGYIQVNSGWPDLYSYDEGDLVFFRDVP
jgi:RimJ/RimL family protein N-acetyltransferase